MSTKLRNVPFRLKSQRHSQQRAINESMFSHSITYCEYNRRQTKCSVVHFPDD